MGHVCPASGASPHGLWVSLRAVPVSPLLGRRTQTADLGSCCLGPHLLGALPPWSPLHPRVGDPAGVSSVALPPLLLATGAWLLTLPRAPLFLHRDPPSRLGAHFGLVLLEMQEKPQPRALRGAEAGGLIGSILGEFLWRAGHPLPEPQGARLAFLFPSHAYLLPPPPWGESCPDEDSLGREGCAFPQGGARCQFPPWWLRDAGFVDGHLLSLQNSSCSR